MPVPAAFWHYNDEFYRWRLLIASPLVDKLGPKSVYTRVQAVIHELDLRDELSLWVVSVVSPKETVVEALKSSLRLEPYFSEIRLAGEAIENRDLEDEYIYRLEP